MCSQINNIFSRVKSLLQTYNVLFIKNKKKVKLIAAAPFFNHETFRLWPCRKMT